MQKARRFLKPGALNDLKRSIYTNYDGWDPKLSSPMWWHQKNFDLEGIWSLQITSSWEGETGFFILMAIRSSDNVSAYTILEIYTIQCRDEREEERSKGSLFQSFIDAMMVAWLAYAMVEVRGPTVWFKAYTETVKTEWVSGWQWKNILRNEILITDF